MLGYKILSGYVWTYLHCPDVVMVAKTDDNVELELEMMMTGVRNMENKANINKVICGTGMVTKNLPVIRYYMISHSNKFQIFFEPLGTRKVI